MSTVTVGDIAIELRARFDQLQSDMEQAKAAVRSGVGEMQAMGNMLKGYFAAIGIGNLGGIINSTIEAAGALKQLSEKTGATVEGLSALKSVAKLSGTDIDSVASAMNKLTKNLGSADEDSKGAAEAIKALGINFDTFKKLSPDQQMLTVAKAMSNFKDNAALSDAAMRLFGKSGADMLPMLKDLAEKGSLNGKVTKEQAEAADAFEKQLIKLKGSMEGAVRSAILPMLSYLGTLGPLLQTGATIAAAYFAVFVAAPAVIMAAKMAFDAMAVAIVEGGGAAGVLNMSLLTLGPTFAELTTQVGVFKMAMLTAFGVIAAAWAGWEIGKWLSDNFLEARLAGIALIDGLMSGWEYMKYGAQVAWLAIKTAASEALAGVGSLMASLLDKMSSGLSVVGMDGLAKTMAGYADALRQTTSSATDFTAEHAALKDQLDQALGSVHSITDDMANEAIEHFNVAKAAKENGDAKEDLAGKLGKAAKGSKDVRDKVAEVIAKLKDEIVMLRMTSEEAEIYKKQKEAGVTANSAAGREIARLVTQFRTEKQVIDDAKAAMEAAQRAMDQYNDANTREVKTIQDAIDRENFRIQTLGMSRSAVEELRLAKMESALEDARRVPGEEAEVARLEKLIKFQKEYTDTVKRGDIADANKKAMDDSIAWWNKATEQVEKSLSDALVHGFEKGKDFFTSLRDYIVHGFEAMVIRIMVQPVMGALGSMMGIGDAAAATGSAGGGSGSVSKLLSHLGSIGSAIGTFGSGFTAGLGAVFGEAGTMGGLSAGTTALGAGNIAGGLGTLAGTALPWVAGAMALKSMMDYKVTPNGSGLTASLTSNGTTTGKVGAFQQFKQEGGLFGGGNTTNRSWSVADQGTTDFIIASVQANTAASKEYARVLGLNADALDGFTKNVEINTDGMDAAAAKAAINAELAKFAADQVDAAFGTSIAAFQKSGETMSETLQRLATMQVAFTSLNEFGGVFSKVAALGYEGRDSMIQLAGGIDALLKKSQDFVSAYYSAEEQSGMAAKTVLEQLKAAGVQDAASLQTKDQFRALVEAIDVTTQAGRQQLNALLTIAPAFAQLADTLKNGGLNLGDLATKAPQVAALDPMFSANSAINASATNGQDATTAAIDATTSAITSGTTAVVGAINTMASGVASSMTSAVSASTEAVRALTAKLDAIDSNNRLALAGGGA